jgi:hypothetical protein
LAALYEEAGLTSTFAAVLPFSWGSLPRLTQAYASPDSSQVIVEHPHPKFTPLATGSR